MPGNWLASNRPASAAAIAALTCADRGSCTWPWAPEAVPSNRPNSRIRKGRKYMGGDYSRLFMNGFFRRGLPSGEVGALPCGIAARRRGCYFRNAALTVFTNCLHPRHTVDPGRGRAVAIDIDFQTEIPE